MEIKSKDIESTGSSKWEQLSASISSSIEQPYKSETSKIKHYTEFQTPKEQLTDNNLNVTQGNYNANLNMFNLKHYNNSFINKNENKNTENPIMHCASDTVDTSDIANSTPNVIFQNLSMPNLPIEKSQILNADYSNLLESNLNILKHLTDLPNHISEENLNDITKSSLIQLPDFKFPSKPKLNQPYISNHNSTFILENKLNDIDDNYYEDSNKIQMLNISEPFPSNRFIQDIRGDNQKLHNISLDAWNKSKNNFTEEYGLIDKESAKSNSIDLFNTIQRNPTLSNNNFDLQTISTRSSNVLLDELKKEIKQNGNHQIHIQQSLPNLRLNEKAALKNRGSFSKVLKSSISTSNLNISNPKYKLSSRSLNLHHQKSNSLSALSTPKSKSTSPLKKFMNLKEIGISTKADNNLIPTSPKKSQSFDLDLNLVNSIRHSPKKKLSIRSISSKTKNQLSTKGSPAKMNFQLDDFSDLESELIDNSENKLQSLLTKGKTLSSNNKAYFNDIIDQIVPEVLKTNRVFSGTDKSTVSNTSVPSGYYGEYDKEKWRVFKKVNRCNSPSNFVDLSNLSAYSTSHT
jgi:hypothetical protein